MTQNDANKNAARVATLCLEFLAEEIEAGRIQPEAVSKAMRMCAAYAKRRLPAETLLAWPQAKDYFKAVVWPELIGKKTSAGVRVQ